VFAGCRQSGVEAPRRTTPTGHCSPRPNGAFGRSSVIRRRHDRRLRRAGVETAFRVSRRRKPSLDEMPADDTQPSAALNPSYYFLK